MSCLSQITKSTKGIIEIPVLLAIVAFIVTSAALFATTNPNVSVTPLSQQTCWNNDPGTVKFNWTKGPAGLHYEVSWEGIAGTTDVGDVGEIIRPGFPTPSNGPIRWYVRAFDPETEEAGPTASGEFTTDASCPGAPPPTNPSSYTCSWSPATNVPVGGQSTITMSPAQSPLLRFTPDSNYTFINQSGNSRTYRFNTAGTWTFDMVGSNGQTLGSCPISTTGAINPTSPNCIANPPTVGINQNTTITATGGAGAPYSFQTQGANPNTQLTATTYTVSYPTSGLKTITAYANGTNTNSATCNVNVTDTTSTTQGAFDLKVAPQYTPKGSSLYGKSITTAANTTVDLTWNIPANYTSCTPSYTTTNNDQTPKNDWKPGTPDLVTNPQGGPHGVYVSNNISSLSISCPSPTGTLVVDTVQITILSQPNGCLVSPASATTGQTITVTAFGGGLLPYKFTYDGGTLVGQATSTGVTIKYATPGEKTITVTSPANPTPGSCKVTVNAPLLPNACIATPNSATVNQNIVVAGSGGSGIPHTFQHPGANLVGQATSTSVTISYPPGTQGGLKPIYVRTPGDQTPGTCYVTLTSPPAGPFSVVTPANGQQGVSGNPTFSWTKSTGATRYRVAVTSGNSWYWAKVVDGVALSTGWDNGSGWEAVEAQFRTIPAQLPAGVYRWSASALNDSGQTTPAGNINSFTVSGPTPTPTPPATKVDLVVSSITFEPQSPTAGQPMQAKITVKNLGNKAAGTFYNTLAIGSVPNPCGNFTTPYVIQSLEPSGQAVSTVNMFAPQTPGPTTVEAYTDVNCTVEESNEANNATKATFTTVAFPTPTPSTIREAPTITSGCPNYTVSWKGKTGFSNNAYRYTVYISPVKEQLPEGTSPTSLELYFKLVPADANSQGGTTTIPEGVLRQGGAPASFTKGTTYYLTVEVLGNPGEKSQQFLPIASFVYAPSGCSIPSPTPSATPAATPPPGPPQPPAKVSPSGDINSGTQDITWTAMDNATFYRLRVNDLNDKPNGPEYDPPICDTNTKQNSGDICKTVKSTTYSYNFEPGHVYNIWVHSVNDAGESPLTGVKANVIGGAADLIVESITFSNDQPKVGEKFQAKVTVKNIGTGTSGHFYNFIDVFLPVGGGGGCSTFTTNYSMNNLGPGESETFVVDIAAPTGPGKITFKAQTDVSCLVEELKEDNNTFEASVIVPPTPGSSPTVSPLPSSSAFPTTSPQASSSAFPTTSPQASASASPANTAPNKPFKPTGPTTGTVGQLLDFTFVGTDPENQYLQYSVDWGQGGTTTMFNVPSGTSKIATWAWQAPGTYEIKMKTWDGQLTSPYSDALVINITSGTSTTSCVDVSIAGSPSSKLDMTFVPLKYSQSQMGTFATDVDHAISRIRFYDPYPAHPNAINYHRVDVADFNPDNASPSQLLSNTAFKNMANNCPTDVTIGVYNDSSFSNGIAILNGFITIYDKYFLIEDPDLIAHELEHAYVGLSDEYNTYRTPTGPNCSASNTTTPWQGFPGTSVIGGCSISTYYRSSQNSIMNEIDPSAYNRPDGLDPWNIKLTNDKLNAYDN